MKRLFVLFPIVFSFAIGFAQSSILLYSENFEIDTMPFNFTTGGVGADTGNNTWVINNLYTGPAAYLNTPSEDSVVSGTIYNAPYSKYLHIYDKAAFTNTGIGNAGWNPSKTSDVFASMNSSFCTLGLTNVGFAFFWTCQGDSNAYGQVYYKTDTGAWIQTGQSKYYGESKWKYESIQNPAFNNVQNLQFGFRWVNSASADTPNVSFAVDDIVAAGTYDSVNSPVKISVTAIADTICQGNAQEFLFALSQPLCDGNYQIQMSNANGSFSNPYNLGQLSLNSGTDTGYFSTIGTPGNLIGNCFRLRTIRISPSPLITSDTSNCFSIIQCPNTIFNVVAPVFNDQDTTCVQSEMDILFNSIGVFPANNIYTAQLSDTNGSFLNPTALGTLISRDSFPGFPRGDIQGIIPSSVSPGCGYFVRVISSAQAGDSTVIGPFCLKQCDEFTNNHTDIHFCVASGPYNQCDTISIHPHEWNNTAQYSGCNEWKVELRSMMDFSLVNSGGLATYHDSIGGSFKICVPSTADSLQVPPGEYYMRIVSTCSNEAWNETGTVIRITIGAPSTTAPVIVAQDTVVCNTGEIALTLTPFNNPPSQYLWSSNLLNNGIGFYWPYDPLLVSLNTNVTLGTYEFYVQENNFGCMGPLSSVSKVTVIGLPTDRISPPALICPGDTVDFSVPFINQTYYTWQVSGNGSIINPGNNESQFVFPDTGAYRVYNKATNACGQYTDSVNVNAHSIYSLNISGTTEICLGQTDTLIVVAESIEHNTQVNGAYLSTDPGAMFNIIAHGNVTIDSIATTFASNGVTAAKIFGKTGTFIGYEQNPAAWALYDSTSSFVVHAGSYNTIPFSIAQQINNGDTFAFYLTSYGSSIRPQLFISGPFAAGDLFLNDNFIIVTEGVANAYPFGTYQSPYMPGIRVYYTNRDNFTSFEWNTGQTSQSIYIVPTQNGLYTVKVQDIYGCNTTDSVYIDTLHCTTGIEDISGNNAGWTIIPNPATSTISFYGINHSKSINIYNLDGQKVAFYEGFRQLIDVSQFAGGIYTVVIEEEENVSAKKLIIIK